MDHHLRDISHALPLTRAAPPLAVRWWAISLILGMLFFSIAPIQRMRNVRIQPPTYPTTERRVSEASNQQCEWCAGTPDGAFADVHSTPPCSVYFVCEGGELQEIHECPRDECFSARLGHCAPNHLCNCPTPLSQNKMGHPRLLAVDKVAGRVPINWAEVNALWAFKSASLDPKGTFVSWVIPRKPQNPYFVCKWIGVTCGEGTNMVVSLTVNNPTHGDPTGTAQPLFKKAGVTQGIPPQIGNLTGLSVLDLSYNGVSQGSALGGLVGPIPSQLGRCTKLQTLLLNNNALSGTIPESLSSLTNLQVLNLASNSFSGSLPSALSSLVHLTSLTLTSNNFTGSIPMAWSGMQSLAYLVIHLCPLNGSLPSSLGQLISLTQVDIGDLPYLSSSIPISLSRLSKLQTLSLQYMDIHGQLPNASWWQELPSLSFLTITGTNVSGPLPSSFSPGLQDLLLPSNRMNGTIPASLFKSLSKSLGVFNIFNNNFTGPVPSTITTCTNLRVLSLGQNMLSGMLPAGFLANVFPSLSGLTLSYNNFSGTFPSNFLQRRTALGTFNISHNQFSGPAPVLPCFGTDLRTIDMAGNDLTGSVERILQYGPPCVPSTSQPGTAGNLVSLSSNRLSGRLPPGWLSNLAVFHIDGNNISGALPNPPKDCSLLQVVTADSNNLQGQIPAALLNKCLILSILDLSHNNLSGSIPLSTGNSTLIMLSLSNNKLTGTIPAFVSNLGSLTSLDISRNSLTGPLPPSLSLLPNLKLLNASSNELSGLLLPEFAGLLNLNALDLSFNALYGNIPGELAPPFLNNLQTLNISHNELNGTIPYGFLNDRVLSLRLDLSSNNLSGPVPGLTFGPLSSMPSALSNNSGLCGGAGYPDCPLPPPSGGLSSMIITLICVYAVASTLAFLIFLVHIRRTQQDPWRRGALLQFKKFDPPLTVQDILDGTDHFSDDFVLGRGGFGAVYRVTLPSGVQVAVKRLAQGSSQGVSEFKVEVESLAQLSHRNVIKLLAAYVPAPPFTERLLVYELLTGGSLDTIIFGDILPGSPFSCFPVRRSVALDVARGLKYLHCQCNPGIIHRDIKPANILLDENLTAYLADFGLAIDMERWEAHVSLDQKERMVGTAGYGAPEVSYSGKISFKSDVYAYGVTLIQMMTGRNPRDTDIVERGLGRWAAQGASCVDQRVEIANEEELQLVLGAIRIGVLCISRVPVDRPSMDEVVELLDKLESFVHGSRDTS